MCGNDFAVMKNFNDVLNKKTQLQSDIWIRILSGFGGSDTVLYPNLADTDLGLDPYPDGFK